MAYGEDSSASSVSIANVPAYRLKLRPGAEAGGPAEAVAALPASAPGPAGPPHAESAKAAHRRDAQIVGMGYLFILHFFPFLIAVCYALRSISCRPGFFNARLPG
jgi:hypothetical protein